MIIPQLLAQLETSLFYKKRTDTVYIQVTIFHIY